METDDDDETDSEDERPFTSQKQPSGAGGGNSGNSSNSGGGGFHSGLADMTGLEELLRASGLLFEQKQPQQQQAQPRLVPGAASVPFVTPPKGINSSSIGGSGASPPTPIMRPPPPSPNTPTAAASPSTFAFAPASKAASPPSSPAVTHDSLVAQAREKYSSKDFAAAHKRFSDALKLKPDDAMVLSNRAACSMMLGQYEHALFDCARAVYVDPEYSSAYMRRARALLSLGELDAACLDAAAAEGAAAMSARSATSTASVTQAKAMVNAITALRRAEENAARDVEARAFANAIAKLDRALEECTIDVPLSLTATNIRAKALKGQAQYSAACDTCAAGLPPQWDGVCEVLASRARQTPLAIELGVTYALCVWCAEDADKAERILKAILHTHPGWEAAYQLLERMQGAESAKSAGNGRYRGGDYEGAVHHYTRAINMQVNECPPFRANIYSNRAAAYMAMGKFTDAINDSSLALEVSVHHVKARLRRARCYVATKTWSRALADFSAVLEAMRSGQSHAGPGARVDATVASIEAEAATVKQKMADEERERRQREREREQERQRNARNQWQSNNFGSGSTARRAPSPKPPDYYSILGVGRDFNEADLKKAYRLKALETHPDKGGDAERFKLVAEAYNTLNDRAARSSHDIKVAAWTRKWGTYASGATQPTRTPSSNPFYGFASSSAGWGSGAYSSSSGFNRHHAGDDEEEEDGEEYEDEEDEEEEHNWYRRY
jgi:DnaJ family protein C protein 7